MSVKLLTEHQLEFLSLQEAAQARLSLHLSKFHIVGNHMLWQIYFFSWLDTNFGTHGEVCLLCINGFVTINIYSTLEKTLYGVASINIYYSFMWRNVNGIKLFD